MGISEGMRMWVVVVLEQGFEGSLESESSGHLFGLGSEYHSCYSSVIVGERIV